MNIATDEFGNPFIILREQEEKKRLKGANITAAKAVADSLRSSLGPKGMDKIIVGPDGDITVTNDGATILDRMQIKHQCAKLLVDLSRSQDAEIGDGTTGVVILAGNLLSEALRLIDKGLHPLRVADGFEAAAQIAVKCLEEAAIEKDVLGADQDLLRQTAKTALGSKVVSSCKEKLADLCVQAVLAVADKERKDVNLDMIKLDGRAGGLLEQSTLVRGIVLHKDLSHSQMRCGNARAVTLVLYGGTQMLVAEAERSVHDALCVVSALVRDGRVVAGGGAAEIAAARAVENQADTVPSVGQYAARAFADALLGLAEALAANSGLSPIHEVQRVKALQQQTNCPYYGIDCMQTGTNDMREQQVWEPLASKKQQILLASQVVKMILKIDDVICPNEE
ncbi:TCP-1/cpn60 family chaperonin, putative [Eimeria praecox]|uniref:TCP-1/cpn60 family chaperonin, putative n=1 Tax=Eimeria praecox TaxID=51316 RepID=U6G9J1_9EIME|nr:TCP-1/cpn60 family chaperonin, putative [Eimeria praecox]